MEVCDSTYVSFVLGFLYLLLMAAIVVYIVRLLTRPSPPIITASLRPPAISSFSLSSSFSSSAGYQKAFLLCTLLETTLRCLYFTLWPFLGQSCQPSLTSAHFHWIDVSAPAAAAAAARCHAPPVPAAHLLCWWAVLSL